MKISVRLQWNPNALYRRRSLGSGVRRVLAETTRRLSEPYVPRDTGALLRSAKIAADGRELRYTTPYAAAQYYGQFRHYHNNGSGLRGPQWAARMAVDRHGDLLQAIARAVGGRSHT